MISVLQKTLHHSARQTNLAALYFEQQGRIIGTLRSNNGDVHESVVEKWTSHLFKLFRDYPTRPVT